MLIFGLKQSKASFHRGDIHELNFSKLRKDFQDKALITELFLDFGFRLVKLSLAKLDSQKSIAVVKLTRRLLLSKIIFN